MCKAVDSYRIQMYASKTKERAVDEIYSIFGLLSIGLGDLLDHASTLAVGLQCI